MSGWGGVLIKIYLWTPTFEFHNFHVSWNVISLNFSTIQKYKCKFRATQKEATGRIWPVVCSLLTPALKKRKPSLITFFSRHGSYAGLTIRLWFLFHGVTYNPTRDHQTGAGFPLSLETQTLFLGKQKVECTCLLLPLIGNWALLHTSHGHPW